MGPAIILRMAVKGLLGWPCNGDGNFEKLPEIAAQFGVAAKYIYKKVEFQNKKKPFTQAM